MWQFIDKRRFVPAGALALIASVALLLALTVLFLFGKSAGPVAGAGILAPDTPRLSPLQVSALISTTVKDFRLPGTQPGALAHEITSPSECAQCHAFYNQTHDEETWYTWQGSMMSLSARDPLFYAALDIANADAEGSGEFCLRCHVPRAWLEGRSTPEDGSALILADWDGVQCEVCHRMVDPFYEAGNPQRDLTVLAGLTSTVPIPSSGMMVVDPMDYRRGPFRLQDDWGFNPHQNVVHPDIPTQERWPLVSPFHQESAMCGTCHDIVNPLFTWDEGSGSYQLNALDTPGDPENAFPMERTYSEWLLSDYATETGVFNPTMGGNKDFVRSCQDCHMRDVTGIAGTYFGNHVVRDDMPLHDLTGANTWVPQAILAHPEYSDGQGDDDLGLSQRNAINDGIVRARFMLQNAASLKVSKTDNQLQVTVINETGHKLPTGYPEGRRMWLQVEGYDISGTLVFTSGEYIDSTAELIEDPDLKLYEVHLGLTDDWADTVGLPSGESFHFAINNTVIRDNRIPPRGFDYDAFLAAGAAPTSNGTPDPSLYADGQYWDITTYELPEEVVYGTVRLLYQTATREYIEFLRDNNPFPGDPDNRGQVLYDLWEVTGRSAPEVMAEAGFHRLFLPLLDD